MISFLNYLLILLLFPLRLFTFISIHIVSVCIPKTSLENNFRFINFVVLLTLGLYPNKIVDMRKNKIDTKIIIFTHRSFADAYIMNYIFGPISYVFRERLLENPIVKYYIKTFGGVAVSSDSKSGKTKEILDYLKFNPSVKLAIAPEDITITKTRVVKNNDLGVFRTGAFAPLLPIQPVAIYFHDQSTIWRNYEEENISENIIHWLFRRFLSSISYFDIYLLEECKPQIKNIKEDAITYRETVRNQMLDVVKHF
jgi:1-acyl-sn-glycerol-3-phosphate acyltransferase